MLDRRQPPTRWILGAGIILSAITAITLNLGDLRRLAGNLSLGACVVLSSWLINHCSTRRTDRRLLRVAELEATQLQQLRTVARRLIEDTEDNTTPQPLRRVK